MDNKGRYTNNMKFPNKAMHNNPNMSITNTTIYLTPMDDEDPYTELSLINRLDDKFSQMDLWIKGKCNDLKKEMFDLTDDLLMSVSSGGNDKKEKTTNNKVKKLVK